MSKKNMLIIAPNPPYYDRASGDKRLFEIIKTIAKIYNVSYYCIGVTRSEEDKKYVLHLNDFGIKVYYRDTDFMELLENEKFQIVFFEFYKSAEYLLPRIRLSQFNCHIVIDSVDVHFVREKLMADLTHNSDDLKLSEMTKKKELSIYRRADLTIAVSTLDADILRNEDANIHVSIIPNIHEVIPRSSNSGVDKSSLIFIGGFSHKPNIDAVIYFYEKIFPILLKKRPLVKLRIIGSSIPECIKKIAGKNIEVVGYVPNVTPYLHGSYISISPLRYGAGMKGKVGEAMAHGIPVVTTSIGIQGLSLNHQQNIMIGDTPDKFANCILELMDNEQLYKSVAENALRYAIDNFTIEKQEKNILKTFDVLLKKPVKTIAFFEKFNFLMQYLLEKFKVKGDKYCKGVNGLTINS